MKHLLKMLLILVVAVLTFSIGYVKAETLEEGENENTQGELVEEKKEVPSTNESERKDEKVEESKVEEPKVEDSKVEEPKKEEPTREVKAAEEPETDTKDKTCKVTITFKEESDSGKTIASPDRIAISYSNTLSVGDGWSKISKKVKDENMTWTSGSSKYTLDGWYEADGTTKVPTSMWYDANTPSRIRVSFSCTADSPDEVSLTYILKWTEEKGPVYIFNVIDNISTGDAHWDNTDGHFGEYYSHKFATPDPKTYYEFLYYKMNDIVMNAGDTYRYELGQQAPNTTVEETFYAWWKADITLNLYDGTKLLATGSQFDSIAISDVLNEKPKKEGYRFLGWVDENNEDVADDASFDANEASPNPERKTVNLTAKWLKVVNITVTKTWEDGEDAEGKRPSSVTVHVNNGDETVDSVELNDENEWTYSFEEPELDGETPIDYTVSEDEVDGYNTYISGDIQNGFIIKNVLYYDTLVTKIWIDSDNELGIRPDSITIHLFDGEEEIDSVELNEENGWTHSFEKLDAYRDGELINYLVTEDEIESYELVSVEGDAKEGFVVTNEFVGGTGEGEEEESSNNPKTADSIYTYISLLLISAFGLIKFSISYAKGN